MDRKEKVKILGKHLGIKPKYLGVQSFAYEVGDFTITREGTIIDKAGDEMKLDEILNSSEETTETEFDSIEISFPMEGHDERTIKNLLNMIYSKQSLIKKVFDCSENIVEKELIDEISTLESLSEILTTINKENCKGIDFNDEKLTFNFINGDIQTSSEFLSLLIKKAKELQYTSSKPIETDNDKYTFRTWLIRLGMIGPEYKAHRKTLLSSLTGSSAFRNGLPANKEVK
ncbi:virulence-related protein [Wansuia hejianensis]|uniref:Virulence-related protein n=1 Tax=Wansuia hejianensis TaxID=2763667 RepID=A0A926IMD9_9FIRM|nr:virulence-related protein [Wansuia hejianensis]MBC8591104.1 virulence-related protein [Wansuia hejianensis]